MAKEAPQRNETEVMLRRTGYSRERLGRREISVTDLFRNSQARKVRTVYSQTLGTAITALAQEFERVDVLSPFSAKIFQAEKLPSENPQPPRN